MFKNTQAFSGFSVDDPKKAKDFYQNILGLEVSDGKMGGMSRIPHQNDMRVAVEAAPPPANQPVEIEPSRPSQMASIGHELRAVEGFGENLLAERDRAVLVELA